MRLRRLVVSTLAGIFAGPALATAHDVSSHAPNIGLPPRADESQKQLMNMVPQGLSPAATNAVRGVIVRSLRWANNQTLIVCFLEGTPKARVRVMSVAGEWLRYINLRLDGGDVVNPRNCGGSDAEDIRVGFDANDGAWSWIGLQSKKYAGKSMNLAGVGENRSDYGVDKPSDPEAEVRRVILHEFGHAFAFHHEHQSPEAKCWDEFNKAAMSSWAAAVGWSAQQVETNFNQLLPQDVDTSARHDRKSIMHYSLPENFFTNGKANRCWVPVNMDLSEEDKSFANQMYPIQVASLTRGATRSVSRVDPEDAEPRVRADLQRSYEEALKGAGVAPAEVSRLTARYKQALTKLRATLPRRE